MASGYAAPDFKPSVNRPSLSPSQRRQQEELTDDDEGGVPYSVDESKKIRGVLSDRTLPVWSRFGTLICMYAGFAPVDALDLLRNKGVIEWGKGKGGLVWYRNSRHKTAVRIFVPLAPALAAALRPYRTAEGGIDIGEAIPIQLNSWREGYAEILGRAGVAKMKGQNSKRLRTSFQSIIETRIILTLPEGPTPVSAPVRRRLMAHTKVDRKEGAIGHYGYADPELMVAAVVQYEAYLERPVAATKAEPSAG